MSASERPPYVSDAALLAAVSELARSAPSSDCFPAKFIATHLALRGTPRLGVRASSKGNWSGLMSPALQVSSQLRRLHREGALHAFERDGRWYYRPVRDGDRPYRAPVRLPRRPYQPGPRKPRPKTGA